MAVPSDFSRKNSPLTITQTQECGKNYTAVLPYAR
jgi:hypothetical protein